MAKKLPETIVGNYSAIPHSVLDSIAFTGATSAAKALMFAIIRQINGRNNGHLHLAPNWLKKQGFTSSTNHKAKDELIERGLIVQTKWGGLRIGTNLYAVTWLPLTNYVGLGITEGAFIQGEWARCDLPPTPRRPKPKNRNQDNQYDNRNSLATITVIEEHLPNTATVTKTAQIDKSSTTATVNNVVNTNTPYKTPRRTVGAKGRSGIKRELYEQ